MRTRISVAAIALAVLSFPAARAHEAGPAPRCERMTVFTAKAFYTMDPGRPTAKALAVCNGRIVGLGDSVEDLSAWTSNVPTAVDKRFEDKVVFPGFIDSHQHPLLGAMTANLPNIAALDTPQAYGPDIKGVKTEAEAFERMRRFEAEIKDPAQPLLVWGWDVPLMGRHLTRQDLDKISSTRPVLVWDASQHHGYVNSVLIAQRKMPSDLKIPGVGRDDKGELNGQFLGVPAASYAILPLLVPKLQPAEASRLMRWLIDLNRRNGITTTTDHSVGIFNVDAEVGLLNAVFNAPTTPQRLMAIPDVRSFVTKYGSANAAIDAVRALQAKSTDRLIYRGAKFFTDDSFNGLTFKPGAAGYADGSAGLWITPPEQLLEMLEPWWKDGQQLFVHSIGAEAQDVTVSALRALLAKSPRWDHRFTFEHFGMARYDQIRAMKALGAQANVNLFYVWLRGESYAKVVGKARAEDLSPIGTLVREGVPTTIHSDYPIGPPKPLLAVSLAMLRFNNSGKGPLGAGQVVSLQQALRMVTIDAAQVLGLDDRIGSLEPGKLADLTVLDDDPHKVRPAAIRDIPVWGTVLGGQVFPVSEIHPR